MTKSLLAGSRVWHRRVSSILFVFFFLIAVTGLMLGWKSLFSTTVFALPKHTGKGHHGQWLALDSLETAAAESLSAHTGMSAGHPERADLRFKNGYIEFLFDKSYYVRVDGTSGIVTLIERRYGGWIQDIHDGAIVDSWLGDKAGASKKIYSTVLASALLFLTLTGIYLWYKPLLIKRNRATTTP
jgi:hypothetical protein